MLCAALIAAPSLPAATPEPITVFLEGQRREILPVARGGVELVAIDQVLSGLGVNVLTSADRQIATLAYQGREVSLHHGKSLASVVGELRLLSSPALYEDGRWLVPVDAVPRLVGPLLAAPADWRKAPRLLVIGNVRIPRIGVSTFVSGDAVRVVLEASEKVPFRVQQGTDRVTVAVQRDLVDVAFSEQKLAGGIVEWVRFEGGRENLFAIALGRRFEQLRASEQEAPPRLVLEFLGPPVAAAPAAPTAAPAAPVAPSAREVRTIVIDPGHGGEEVGARGSGGTLEKDVTLAIARKLRSALVNSVGLQVFLTRDKDQEIGLDERTAIANNYKADLFVSIHANASRAPSANGSEVYFLSYQASDDETRWLAQREGAMTGAAATEGAAAGAAPGTPAPVASGPPGEAPPPPPLPADLALILWDMAQAEHLEESSALASRIQEELAVVTRSEGRGVKQAPFRVLVGAAMPAVLVEVAFITHPEEEKLLGSEAFQGRVATALARGIGRYESERARRTAAQPGSRPRS